MYQCKIYEDCFFLRSTNLESKLIDFFCLPISWNCVLLVDLLNALLWAGQNSLPPIPTWDGVIICTPITIFFPLGVWLCKKNNNKKKQQQTQQQQKEHYHRRRKQFYFGGGQTYKIIIYSPIAAICAACLNINEVSRVIYWGGPGSPPVPTPMTINAWGWLSCNTCNWLGCAAV